MINSAHDCSDGGISVAIAEQCFASLNNEANGAEISLSNEDLDASTQLFSESPSRIVISFVPESLEKVKEIVGDCPFEIIGKVSKGSFKISVNGEDSISASVKSLQTGWKTSLEDQLGL